MDTNRTDQIIRAIWDLSSAGQYTVRAYRVSERLGYALTPQDVDAVLATGAVEQITGCGGPSSFRMRVTLDDLLSFEHGEFYDQDVEHLAGVLDA